jgi:hypothetical protein
MSGSPMPREPRLRGRVGSALLAVGAAIIAGSVAWDAFQADHPIDEPFNIVAGQSKEWSVRPRFSDRYFLELSATYMTPLNGPDSTLGIVWRNPTHEDSAAHSELRLIWKMARDGRAIAGGAVPGNGGGGWSGGRSFRELGRCQLERGRTYALSLTAIETSVATNRLAPRVSLRRDATSLELWRYLAGWIFRLGLCLIVAGLVQVFRSRIKNSAVLSRSDFGAQVSE